MHYYLKFPWNAQKVIFHLFCITNFLHVVKKKYDKKYISEHRVASNFKKSEFQILIQNFKKSEYHLTTFLELIILFKNKISKLLIPYWLLFTYPVKNRRNTVENVVTI